MTAKIIRVDMSELSVKIEKVPEKYLRLGGRGLTSTILLEEVDPACHPLGTKNKLIIAPGLLAGTTLSSSNRISVGAKSPLTGGIKESNSGGVLGYKLGRLGIKAVIIEGKPNKNGLYTLSINTEGISLRESNDLRGLNTYNCTEELLRKYGSDAGIMVIGSAGERMLASACINCTDTEREPCRNFGRGGMGAVMGSKGLKAIVVDDTAATISKPKPEISSLIKELAGELKGNAVTGEYFAKYGTARNMMILNKLGGLPTRNFSSGQFEMIEEISGEKMAEVIQSRGGKTTHNCMPGCIIRCSNTYVDKQGKPVVSSVEYETLCLMGSNLGISNLDAIAALNKLCNDYGVDTMETGVALGVLAEAGVWEFGDEKRAVELAEEIGKGSPLGRLIASGSQACGKAYGIERVPAVKNQAMAAYDPRVIKGLGVTYATSPMGADHTSGNTIILQCDHMNPKNKAEDSEDLQRYVAMLDTLGMCIFAARTFLSNPQLLEKIVKEYTGWKATFDELKGLGNSIVLKEKEFNSKAGFTKYHDRLPGFMMTEPVKPHDTVFDVEETDMDDMFQR